MRRILVVMLVCVGVVLGVAALASAQTADPSYPPPTSSAPPSDSTGVAGVSAAKTAGASTQLPFTGSDGTSTLLWVGGGLAVVGGLIVVTSYRRRASLQH